MAQWPGTIKSGTESDVLFSFWDVLPTAADLAGLPPSMWGPTDGISIKDTLLGHASPSQGSQTEDRYLYWEFCHYGSVDGLLPQVYDRKGGWIQALRWDDNATQYRTEWKAIRVNSQSENLLLYNITEDQSESHPVMGGNGTSSPSKVCRLELLTDHDTVLGLKELSLYLFHSS